MFDPTKTIRIQLIRATGDVFFVCPWPSDSQLIERSKARKIIAGAVSDSAVEDQAAKHRIGDLAWLKALAPEAVEIDEYEAADIVEQLLACEASRPSRAGGSIEMELATVFGDIPVSVRIPTRPQIATYERDVMIRRENRGVREISMRLEAGSRLYDAIANEITPLPVIYKVAVCGAVVNYLDSLKAATVNP